MIRRVSCASTRLQVEVAGVLRGRPDRVAGDLVEDHAADGDLGLEHLEQVPGDGLALAVLVRGEQQLVGVLELALQLGDLGALVGVDDVQRLEAVVDVDAEPRPGLALVRRRDVGGALGQVADVPHARLDVVARAEVALDRLGLRRALDDDQSAHRRTPRRHGRRAASPSGRPPWRRRPGRSLRTLHSLSAGGAHGRCRTRPVAPECDGTSRGAVKPGQRTPAAGTPPP